MHLHQVRNAMKPAIAGLSLTLLTILVSCRQVERHEASNREAERIRTRFNKLLADFTTAADPVAAAEGYLSAHTKDAILMFPGTEAIQGHAAIRPLIIDFAKAYRFALPDWKSDELIVSGDLAIHRFSGTAVMTSRVDGKVVQERRKYLDVWKKGEDGEWRIARHIYSRND